MMRQANMLLAAALAVAGASAYATSEDDLALSQGEAVVVAEEADADDGVIVAESVPAYSHVSDAAPVASAPAAMPASEPITIEQRRLTLDERIQSDVMDAIYNARHLGGQIGVETNDARVTLTGWTPTAGQARRAAMHAQGVDGVRGVQNLIRPRIGGSV